MILKKHGIDFSLSSESSGIQIINLGSGISPADIDKINNDLNSVD